MIDSSASQEKQPIKVSPSGNFQEQAIPENVTDRLLRPIEINQELETKYSFFESMLRVSNATVNGEKGNLDRWFVEHLNNYFRDRDESQFQEITTEDIDSLKLITEDPALKKFREIYGYNYRRPIFSLSIKDYRTIYRKLLGQTNSSYGMALPCRNSHNDPVTKGLRIIVASGDGLNDTNKHEIKHTLDPQLAGKRRLGKDRVLEEFAAYWGDIIIPQKVVSRIVHFSKGIVTKEEVEEEETFYTPEDVGLVLIHNTYVNYYNNVFSDKKEYIDTINDVTGYIQRLQKKYDKFQIDRILMNVAKIEDLRKCVEEQNL